MFNFEWKEMIIITNTVVYLYNNYKTINVTIVI